MVSPGAARARVVREGRGQRDERHSAFGGLEEPRFARLGEALAGPRVDEAGLLHVASRESHALDSPIPGMVVRSRDDVESRPDELLGQIGISTHPRATALVRWVRLEVVEQHLQVGKCHVSATDEVDHLQELGLLVGREPPSDDCVSGERHRELGSARPRGSGLSCGKRGGRREQDEDYRGRTRSPHRSPSRDWERPGRSRASRARVELARPGAIARRWYEVAR